MQKSEQGSVVAVSSSPRHGYPTYERKQIIVTPWGILGDAHAGLRRDSFTKPGTKKWNDRPISIVAKESLDNVYEQLGLELGPGSFNEQMLVEGLGDLGWVLLGSLIYFKKSGVELEVVDHSEPCLKLAAHTGKSVKELSTVLLDTSRKGPTGRAYTKRGILAKVNWPGIIKPGDTMYVQGPNDDREVTDPSFYLFAHHLIGRP